MASATLSTIQPDHARAVTSSFHSDKSSHQKVEHWPAESDVFGPISVGKFPLSVQTCIHSEISAQSERHPAAEALVSQFEVLTFKDLDRLSDLLSQKLRIRGITGGENVGLCFNKSAWAVISMLAILKCGGSCVPLDPENPPARLESVVKAAAINFILVECQIPQLKDVSQIVVNQSLLVLPLGDPSPMTDAPSRPKISPANNAFALFTSGSSGTPKAVMLTHSAICSSAYYHGRTMNVHPGTRVYQHAAYTFDMSIYDIFTTLMLGSTVCIPSSHDRIHCIPESITQLRANWVFLTPTLLTSIHPSEVPTLRTVVVAGEPVTQELVDTWADEVCLLNGYGSTEMSTCFLARLQRNGDPRSIGYPQGVIAHIIDPNDPSKHVPPEQEGEGELVVAGPVLASGYLRDEKRTTAAFTIDRSVGVRSYRTGDMVARCVDGSYRFLGREDTLVKIRGMRVELGEVEDCLLGHRFVAQAVALYPAQGRHKEQLVAVVQTNPEDHAAPYAVDVGAFFMQKSLSSHVAGFLPSYMVPQSWLFVTQMPLTSSGKIDRMTVTSIIEERRMDGSLMIENLPAQAALPHSTEDPPTPPSTGFATPDHDLAPLDVSFLDLGLDSINLICLCKILKKAYKLEFDIAALGMMSLKSVISVVQESESVEEVEKQGVETFQEPLSEIFMALLKQVNYHARSHGPTCLPLRVAPSGDPKHLSILLTGATGFLGPFILKTLLDCLHPQGKIAVLVRASSRQEGLQQVIRSLSRAKVNVAAHKLDHLEVWQGDLRLPGLGLGEQQLMRLRGNSDQIDAIVHSGAIVNWTHAYEALESPNVSSTAFLLKTLCARAVPGKLIYVSGGRALEIATTADIKGQNRGHPSHSIVSELQRTLNAVQKLEMALVGYDKTKLISESLVLAAPYSEAPSSGGLLGDSPLTSHVVRPGYIIGSAANGYVNASDYIWRVVATALSLRRRPAEPETSWLYVAGVEQVAQQVASPVLQDLASTHEHDITAGIPICHFWAVVSSVFDIALETISSDEWLRVVQDTIEVRGADHHPLGTLLDAHRADGGLMGLERGPECEKGADAQAVLCLQKSLEYLRDESADFARWTVGVSC